MTTVAAYVLALAAYPGLLTMFAFGAVAESGGAWALVPARGGPAQALRNLAAASLRAVTGIIGAPFAVVAIFMALLAAGQIAIPFNPVPPADRNLLIAAFALLACGWLTLSWGWNRQDVDPRLVLLVQVAWLVALISPTIETQTLRPQALGSVLLTGLLPVKIASGLLYVLCLPVLLQLIPESAPQGVPGAGKRRPASEEAGFLVLRALLWLPCCGLFTSLFLPPSGEDLVGVVRFLAVTAGAAAIGLVLSANLIHRGATFTRGRYALALTFMSALTIVIAVVTVIAEGRNIL